MAIHRPSEVINLKFTINIGVPTNELPDIEEFVDKTIKVNIGGVFVIFGELRRVTTWTMKEKNEIIGIYKKLTIEVWGFSCNGGQLRFPDTKSVITEDIEIEYRFEDLEKKEE